MAGLEHLRWLVWFCNVTGVLPFRMENDRKTKKFERFTFSWCHLVTWWFIMIVSFYSLTSVFFFKIFLDVYYSFADNQSKLTTFSMFLFMITNSVTHLCPRILIFQYRKLQKASDYVNKVDQLIGKVGKWPCTSKRRIIIGMLPIFITVRVDFAYAF
jgi:hypothetical protein